MHARPIRRAVVLLCGGALSLGTLPAAAVNADHGRAVVSADPADTTPHVMDGAVLAITPAGDRMVAAGTFSSVSPADSPNDTSDDVVRHGMFAFDPATGAIDPSFDPDLGGTARSLSSDGSAIYVGGSFTSVGGDRSVRRVARLTPTGAVDPDFRAVPDKPVNEVVVRGSRLYLGGAFTAVTSRGTTRTRRALAALDKATGAVRNDVAVPFTGVYDPDKANGGGRTAILRFDVTRDGSRLAAIGNFARVGGVPRVQLAVLDTRPGRRATVAAWRTNRFDRAHNRCARSYDTFTRDIDFAPNGGWFAVSATGAFAGGLRRRTLCDTVSRWETGSRRNDPTWVDYTGGDTAYGVAATGAVVYTGGHMRWQNNPYQGNQAGPGAVPRSGIAALDAVNGLPLSWNPGRTRGVGAQALVATPDGLWVGSDTLTLGAEQHRRLAFLPLEGGTTVPTTPRASLPNDVLVARLGTEGRLQRRPVDGLGHPTGPPEEVTVDPDFSTLRGAFLLGDTMYYGTPDGAFEKRTLEPGTGALGDPVTVDLHDDPDDGTRIPFPIAQVSGMFFDPVKHRLYYTLRGDRRLFYRYFTPASEVVGAQTFVSPTQIDLAGARGLTMASSRLLYGSRTGVLRSVRFRGGLVRGTPVVVSRDGQWRARSLLVPTD